MKTKAGKCKTVTLEKYTIYISGVWVLPAAEEESQR